MKDDAVYNKWNNEVMVKTGGNSIYIVCHKESQVDKVVTKMTTDTCKLSGYEEWDDDEDKKWILTFAVVSDEYTLDPELN